MKCMIPYRVRVRRLVEDWVDVEAWNPAEAEAAASGKPGVVSVFPRSAVRTDQRVGVPKQGVEEE